MPRIVRVFPKKTSHTPDDPLSFVGEPPESLQLPGDSEIHISTTFTWDIEESKRLIPVWVRFGLPVYLGGPAFSSPTDTFVPGKYTKHGVTFTSRGCNNQCPFCLISQREGRIQTIENFMPGNIVQDNNILQCSRPHLERVFYMLRHQKAVQFTGGLDSTLITDWIADELRSLSVYQLFLACDTPTALAPLQRAVNRLAGLQRNKLRCYVLLAHNEHETISDATARLEDVWNAGCLPFAQLYQPPEERIEYSKEWKSLARTWSRPAAMAAIHRPGHQHNLDL